MPQNHVIISNDPAAERGYAALMGGSGVTVYRFGSAAEAMQRFAAVQSPISALVVATPNDPNLDNLLLELTAGSFAHQPLLAGMQICVMGAVRVVHPRIASVRSSQELVAALRASGAVPEPAVAPLRPAASALPAAPMAPVAAVSQLPTGSMLDAPESGLLSGIVSAIWRRGADEADPAQDAAAGTRAVPATVSAPAQFVIPLTDPDPVAQPEPVGDPAPAPLLFEEPVARRQMPRGVGRSRNALAGSLVQQAPLASVEAARDQSPRIEAESLGPVLEPSLPFVLQNRTVGHVGSPRIASAAMQRHQDYLPIQVQTMTTMQQSGAFVPLDVVDGSVGQPQQFAGMQGAVSVSMAPTYPGSPQYAMQGYGQAPVAHAGPYGAPAQAAQPSTLVAAVAPGTPDPMLGWSAPAQQAVAPVQPLSQLTPLTPTPAPAHPVPPSRVSVSMKRRSRFGKLRDRVKAGEQPTLVPNQAQVDAALAQLADGGYGVQAAGASPMAMNQAPVAGGSVFATPSSVMDRLGAGDVQFG